MKMFIWFVLVLMLIDTIHNYLIRLDLNEKQCFQEYIDANTLNNTNNNGSIAKLSLTFSVLSGGFMDVCVSIKNMDDNHLIHNSLHRNHDFLMMAINKAAKYEFCFENDHNSVSQSLKLIRFEVSVILNDHINHNDKLENLWLKHLKEQFLMVKYESEIQLYSMLNHHQLNEQTNFLMTIWAFFEALIIFIIILGQIYYLKHFFETKRYV